MNWQIKFNMTDPLPTPTEDDQWILALEKENGKEVPNVYRSGSLDYWYSSKGRGRSSKHKDNPSEGWNPIIGWAWLKK